MAEKLVSLQVLIRDENNEIINNEGAQGTTQDDGLNIAIPAGYVPNILTALPSDILRTVHQPSVDKPAPASVSRTEDVENSISNLAFTEV